MRFASNFGFLDNNEIYIGRILFRTMHPAYINNRGVHLFFFLLPSRGFIHDLDAGTPLQISGNFSQRELGVARLFFSGARAKKESVNILPCIHVAYSVTLEKLTVYPLKNNVYDISSRLREFDEGAGG